MNCGEQWQALYARLLKAGLKPGLYGAEGRYYIELDSANIEVTIERRPAYCDRGRWLVQAVSQAPAALSIDFADGFPRYYFGDEALVSELLAWLKARGGRA